MSKPRIAIFANKNAGQPITRKDGSVVEYNGKVLNEPKFQGKITLPEGLPAGDYEVGIYDSVSKGGYEYLSGSIKPAFKKREEVEQVAQVETQEELDDSIPF